MSEKQAKSATVGHVRKSTDILLDLRAWLRKDSGYAAWKHQPGSRKCNDTG